jgi:hypothetical protein
VSATQAPKRQRARLAKAELLLHLACTAERWRREVTDEEPGTLPFADWPPDDPLVELCRRYALAPADLARLLDQIGQEVESRALRAGYEEAWV